ncbi:MAG: zinc ribbon domain-containing protein [Ruminococcaceae bacterium]|nr:zinc ribbon domain-containing protein [Oscillospiraceae bacterium]
MAFCIKCGHKLPEGSKYCFECGTPVQSPNETSGRKFVFDGTIHKCPCCGEVLDSFTIKCPSCGYELRDTKTSNALKEFVSKLETIESSREKEKSQFIFFKAFSSNTISKTDQQKINLIRSFSIPNTKEDIFEFMILASSNIDFKLYGLGDNGVLTVSQKGVSDAWLAKFEQAYEKARLLFEGTEDFNSIYRIYKKTNRKLKIEKIKLPLLFVFPFVMLFIIIIGLLLL